MEGDEVARMKILKRIEKVIKVTNNMILEHPTNPMFKVLLRDLDALNIEFSKSNLDKDKIHSLHFATVHLR
jgi:hypothetical protein